MGADFQKRCSPFLLKTENTHKIKESTSELNQNSIHITKLQNHYSNPPHKTCWYFPFYIGKRTLFATFSCLKFFLKIIDLEIHKIIRRRKFEKEAQVKIYKSGEQFRKGGKVERKDALWPHHKTGSIFLPCEKVAEALPKAYIYAEQALWYRNRLQV